ncbi:MAG: hypothetical protein LBJ64_09455 [Deltaproteobacteria bacterium]|jgi:type I restriction enzyme M protein|nr:hypothetical protein [Deltaproteobacteria bacterium]
MAGNRAEIAADGFDEAKRRSVKELAERNCNLDLCCFPREEEEMPPLRELLQRPQEKRASLNVDLDRKLAEIEKIFGTEI